VTPAARESLTIFPQIVSTVILSNISEAQAPTYVRNLLSLGSDGPLIGNGGPKRMAPEVLRIHRIGDARWKGLLPLTLHANFHAGNWWAAAKSIKARLDL
jgi:hypothetical protein